MARFHSFWLPSTIPLYINHIFFIHSSVDGHLGSSHNLAIVDSAAINIGGAMCPFESAFLYPLGKYLDGMIQGVTFGDWLFSLSLMSLRWGGSCLFLFISESCPMTWMAYVHVSNHFPGGGHVGFFHRFWLLQIKLLWILNCRDFCVHIRFYFSRINTQECNCWVIC